MPVTRRMVVKKPATFDVAVEIKKLEKQLKSIRWMTYLILLVGLAMFAFVIGVLIRYVI